MQSNKWLILASFLFSAIQLSSIDLSAQSGANPEPNVIPALHEWIGAEGFFVLDKDTHVIVEQEALSVAATFVKDLESLTGYPSISIWDDAVESSKNSITLKLISDPLLGDEGYRMEISERITVEANRPSGLFYGTQTLLQILAQDGSAYRRIPKGTIQDVPLIKERSFMLDIGRKYFEVNYLKKTIRNLAWLKYNRFHMHLTDWSGFRLDSDKFPGLASEEAYNRLEIRDIQDFAAKYFVTIVPEIDLPAHASHMIQYRPELAFQCESMRTGRWLTQSMLDRLCHRWGRASMTIHEAGWILDITNPEAVGFMTELLNEFIPWFDGPYFHIGGDEWQFDDQKTACPELMAYTEEKGYDQPGDVFVAWINEMNEVVKSHGKTTQIWNWWRFQNPRKNEYNGSTIQPDLDIVINVWNKPREKEILEAGYQIISTTEEGPGALYSTPGIRGRNPGDYGFFDNKYNYESWEPMQSPQVQGYKLCLWTDRLEHMPDEWFDRHSERQKAVLAEKAWGKRGSETIDDFWLRMLRIGSAP